MLVPRYTAGLVLDYLELATGEIAVDASAAVEAELPRRVDRARGHLGKAALHAGDDGAFAAWMGDGAWASFVATLESAGAALDGASRSRARELLWRNLHVAVEHLTAALDFARVLWNNLPQDDDEHDDAVDLSEPESESEPDLAA